MSLSWLILLSVLLCVAASTRFTVAEVVTCSGLVPMRYRKDKISITDFGGVGDGRTLNTKAFRDAIYLIQQLRRRGGTLLHVPPGVYLTESFNLTSHMTLYLARGAVIKATQVRMKFTSSLNFLNFFHVFDIFSTKNIFLSVCM
uniref:Uncharacterized protein n=1 Tax=Rhizophora mucronata TaxID=61149 RepID=A0A2P2LUK5_RHIMU